MIGQNIIQSTLDEYIMNNDLPGFMIIVGPRGSGKKTLVNDRFHGVYLRDNKVESVREMIQQVYTLYNTTFIMFDCDTMSFAAKNALLKVVEECPNNNRFIMTLSDKNSMPDTIKSRAQIFNMDMYNRDDLSTYYVEYTESLGVKYDTQERIIAIDICETPGEIQMLVQYGVTEFYKYVTQVVDHIALVSGANSFKIADRVALKDGDSGYDLKLFLTAFIRICLHKTSNPNITGEKLREFAKAVFITSGYISKAALRGINKRGVMDMWILDIRKAWA